VRIKTEPAADIRAGHQARVAASGTSYLSPVERKNAEADLFMAQIDAFLGENPSEDRMRLAEEIRALALKEGISFAEAIDRQIEAVQNAPRYRRSHRHRRRRRHDPAQEEFRILALVAAMLVFLVLLAMGSGGFCLFLIFAVAAVVLVREFFRGC
jgi:hypothetical protein